MRLDVFLSSNALAKSRSYAQELIKKGLVTVDGKVITKASFEVNDEKVEVTGEAFSFVGRGGVKLDAALDAFSLDVDGLVALDVGASTGGFTDCLLKRGAAKVYAVDSGHGQLDEKLLCDKRVINMEGFNARDISPDTIGEECDAAVCDLSFISQTLVIKETCTVLKDGGIFVTLIKPQFECGRSALGKGGIIKDKKHFEAACLKVIKYAEGCGLGCMGLTVSPIKGGDGNTEFLAYFVKGGISSVTDKDIREVTMGDKTGNTSFKS